MLALISVIVPVYNVAPYLRKAVQSIMDQTYSNLEIILVNDGSTDQSGDICDQLAREDDRIHVIHQANAGVSQARNRALELVQGDYLLSVDPDDYIDPRMVESLYQLAIEEEAPVAICQIVDIHETGESRQFDQPYFKAVYDREAFLRAYLLGREVAGSICNKLIRRDVYQQLRFLPDKVYEDAFYHYDLMQLVDRYAITGQAYYYYYHRGDSLTTKSFSPSAMDAVEVYQKIYDWTLATYPNLASQAFFRLAHAHFTAFDRLIQLEDYQHNPYYQPLLDFLRGKALNIFLTPHFRMARRLAALALGVSVPLYRRLMLKDLQQNKGIHQHDSNQTDQ